MPWAVRLKDRKVPPVRRMSASMLTLLPILILLSTGIDTSKAAYDAQPCSMAIDRNH